MLHACNAVDGTAAKALSHIRSNNERFSTLLRNNYFALGIMGMPGINLADTRFPISVANPKAPGGGVDLADIIYGIHRCTHGHGSEMPDGFELLRDSVGPPERTTIKIQRGKIQLSDRIIFGLLAVAVLAPENVGQTIPPSYWLSLGAENTFAIHEWWGRREDFEAIASTISIPNITVDFSEWMNDPTEAD